MTIFVSKQKLWTEYLDDSNTTKLSDLDSRMNERLAVMKITKETLNDVRQTEPILTTYKTEIMEQFYHYFTSVTAIKDILEKHTSKAQISRIMEAYLTGFLQAKLDKEYIMSRIYIGQQLSKINVTAEHFIAAHHVLIQCMTTILMNKLHRRHQQLINTSLAIQKLAAFDQHLIVEVYMEETMKSFLFGISDMLNDVTQLDTAKHLIEKMENIVEASHSVSSSTEQVSASINEVANHAVKVAEGTEEAVTSAEKSKHVIHTALKDIQQMGTVYNDVVTQIKQLNEEIEQTQSIVKVIQEITEQTNLLALNASIEAARAGEHGQGFSVVANEVRKLAEHTKEQTLQITKNMESLQEVSHHVTTKMNSTERLVNQSITEAQHADEALQQIISSIQGINASTSQIAAMTEEQTSAVTEIAERNTAMFDLGNLTMDISKQTAQIIFDLSKQIDKYRLTFFQTNIEFQAKDIVKAAITDHLLWKWRVYNMLLDLETLDSKRVSSHKACRLGKWYYSDLPAHITSNSIFQQLEEPHQKVHHYAKLAIESYEQGDRATAQQYFEQLQAASSQVISLLTQLEKQI